MNSHFGDRDYSIWCEKLVIADCLRKLGLESMANILHTDKINESIMENYVKIAHKLALNLNDEDVIERLCYAGLIYG